ncbi:MAG: hypothetical protein M1818_003227 [Claussenomyces sp. TS43310]|nr:MAG: hypothetical protein M1818_003227 [Claussenomyces sp. TS43310]
MMFKPLLAGVGFAALSQAFLLPPSVSFDDTDIVNTLPFEDAAGLDSHSVRVECSDCPIPAEVLEAGDDAWVDGLSSSLLLDFTIKHFKDMDALFLNDVQMYPFHPAFSLKASQIISTPAGAEQTRIAVLGFETTSYPQSESSDDAEIGLYAVPIQITQFGDRYVDGVESVDLKLLKTQSGRMMIADVSVAPPGHLIQHEKPCASLYCGWKATFADKLSNSRHGKGKGCGSKATSSEGHHNGQHRPGHCGQKCHHSHHGIARLSHALKRVTMHVLIPSLINIGAAAIVGTIVGRTIVLLWRALYRRGQRAPEAMGEQEEAVVAEDSIGDNKVSLEHNGAPPIYEDVVMTEKTS